MRNSNPIMLEGAKFLFAFLSKERNAPLTGCMLLLCFFAWWNIRQDTKHAADRYNWQYSEIKKDSSNRAERILLFQKIGALNGEIMVCKSNNERLENRVKELEKKR